MFGIFPIFSSLWCWWRHKGSCTQTSEAGVLSKVLTRWQDGSGLWRCWRGGTPQCASGGPVDPSCQGQDWPQCPVETLSPANRHMYQQSTLTVRGNAKANQQTPKSSRNSKSCPQMLTVYTNRVTGNAKVNQQTPVSRRNSESYPQARVPTVYTNSQGQC